MKMKNIKLRNKVVRTCHDADCPKCGFPETIIIREEDTMKPLWEECSDRSCDWGRKITIKTKK